MARRNSSTLDAPEGTENTEAPEVENTEALEAAVEAEVETPAEDTPTTEGETPAAESDGERDTSGDTVITDGEKEADLAPFIAASQATVAQRDTSTGELPDGALDGTLEAYRTLPSVKDRNRAKAHLKDAMKDAMEQMDLSLARAYLTMQDSMTTAPSHKASERKPADPLAVWKHNLLTATLAYGELAGVGAPEGADINEITTQAGSQEFVDAMNAYRTWLDTEVPEGEDQPEAPKVPAEVVAAFKFARGAKRRGVGTGNGDRTPHDGPRRDLGKHIAEAFADVESGTFLSVAEIRKFKSSEYEDEPPSAGAISARLFPAKGECTVEGITPGTGGEKGTKGAYKA
jgi:hypothetical protein